MSAGGSTAEYLSCSAAVSALSDYEVWLILGQARGTREAAPRDRESRPRSAASVRAGRIGWARGEPRARDAVGTK